MTMRKNIKDSSWIHSLIRKGLRITFDLHSYINEPPPEKNRYEEWLLPHMFDGIWCKWSEPWYYPISTQHINQPKYWDAGHFSGDTIPWAGKGGNAGGSTPIDYANFDNEEGNGEE